MSVEKTTVLVQEVSKKFSRSLKHSIAYGMADITRNVVGLRSPSEDLRPREFWALDDVSFELHRGEILGLIGPNGSGKSTTLKLLNGIFMPDRGRIHIHGRVGALIDVGVGFHPMLTGRENIFVSGAILGLSKREIDWKLDEIIAFSEIEDFIDTPVRFYSSGMYVRLGFSVAIHLDPDVLLIDEVLSVGDMAFGRKCFQRMTEILNSGITVVFVSHAIRHVERICQKALLLHHGKVRSYGPAYEVSKEYYALANRLFLSRGSEAVKDRAFGVHSDPERFEVTGVELLDERRERCDQFKMLQTVIIRFHFVAHRKVEGLQVVVRFLTIDGVSISSLSPREDECPDFEGEGYLDCVVPELALREGVYTITVSFSDRVSALFKCDRAAELSIIPDDSLYRTNLSTGALVVFPARWEFRNQESEIQAVKA